MISYKEDLGWDLANNNFLEDFKELKLFGSTNSVALSIRDLNKEIKINVIASIRGIDRTILLKVLYNDKKIISVEIESPEESNQFNHYDLQSFFNEYIIRELFNLSSSKKKKYTVRNYRYLYNSHNIDTTHKINAEKKFVFGPLYNQSLPETMTEQILYFDIEIEAHSVSTARSIAHNHVSDYSSFLSVFLDVGIDDIKSNFQTFIEKREDGLATRRLRTGFVDQQLGLIVKDNFNGLTSFDDWVNNIRSETISLSNLKNFDSIDAVTYKNGYSDMINNIFENHRLESLNKGSLENKKGNIDNIDIENIRMPGTTIKVPTSIRKYFRGIELLKSENYKKYEFFRNACRMYNLGMIFHKYSPTAHISYHTSAVETLSKAEGEKFTPFINQYNEEYDKKLMDFIYGKVRSGHFHSGEFPFMEFNINLNNSLDAHFFIKQEQFFRAKNILRKTFINWIKKNILD